MIYSRDYIFAISHIFFYNPFIRNYWRGLYFRVSMLSRICAKIKSLRIKKCFTVMTSFTEFNKSHGHLVVICTDKIAISAGTNLVL